MLPFIIFHPSSLFQLYDSIECYLDLTCRAILETMTLAHSGVPLQRTGFINCKSRSSRLKVYDYSKKEAYFITIIVSVHGVPMVFLRSLGTTTSGLSLKIPVDRNPKLGFRSNYVLL